LYIIVIINIVIGLGLHSIILQRVLLAKLGGRWTSGGCGTRTRASNG